MVRKASLRTVATGCVTEGRAWLTSEYSGGMGLPAQEQRVGASGGQLLRADIQGRGFFLN